MRCRKVVEQLSAFLDSELSPREAEQIQGHLDSCPACRQEREDLARTIAAVQKLPTLPAPDGLRGRIMDKIESAPLEAAVPVLPERVSTWRVFWPAAAAILFAVGLMFLTRTSKSPSAPRERMTDAPTWSSEPVVALLDEKEESADKATASQGGTGHIAARSVASDSIGRGEPQKGLQFKAEGTAADYGVDMVRAGSLQTEVLIPSRNMAEDFATLSRLVEAKKLPLITPGPGASPIAKRGKIKSAPETRVVNLLLTPAQFDAFKADMEKAGLMKQALVSPQQAFSIELANVQRESADEIQKRFFTLKKRDMQKVMTQTALSEAVDTTPRTASAPKDEDAADRKKFPVALEEKEAVHRETVAQDAEKPEKLVGETVAPVPPTPVAIILFPWPESLVPPPAASLEAMQGEKRAAPPAVLDEAAPAKKAE